MATESLDKNIFYRSLVTEHIGLFQEAGDNCWLICVPHNNNVRDVVKFDAPFIRAHILKPSPLLRNHFIPINPVFVDDVQLKNDTLLVKQKQTSSPASSSSETTTVKILGSEDAYNDKNKLYRILLINRALTAKHLNEPVEETVLDVQDVVSVEDCRKYLDSISESVRNEVEAKVRRLRDTLLQTPSDLSETRKGVLDLNETQQALNSLFDWSRDRFLHPGGPLNATLLSAQEDPSILDYSIESILLFPFHDDLLRAVEEFNRQESSAIQSQAVLMKSKRLDMSSLGTEEDLDTFYPSQEAIDFLACLPQNKSPMEKMMSFKSVLDLIREDLIACLETAHNPFDCKPMKTLVPDDLVAATIYTVIQSEFASVVMNNLSFVQLLGTKLPVMNEMAYSLVTFEVALAFIRNYKEEAHNSKASPARTGLKKSVSPDQRDRSGSFLSFRNKDPRFDKQLEQLSRMVEELSTTTSNIASKEESHEEEKPFGDLNDDEDDAGDFLSSIHKNSMYGMTYGRLNSNS